MRPAGRPDELAKEGGKRKGEKVYARDGKSRNVDRARSRAARRQNKKFNKLFWN